MMTVFSSAATEPSSAHARTHTHYKDPSGGVSGTNEGGDSNANRDGEIVILGSNTHCYKRGH